MTLAISILLAALAGTPTSQPATQSASYSTPARRATTQPAAVNVFSDGVHDSILLWPQHSGRPDAPTVLKAEHPGKAVIRLQAPFLCGVYSPDDNPVHDVTVSGFVIEAASIEGVRFMSGSRITIQNCIIRNCKHNGSSFHGASDILVDRCVIQDSGFANSPVTVGHGLYADGQRIQVKRCAFIGNSGHGVTLWSPPATSAGSSDCEISGCTFIGQAQANTWAISATHQTNPPAGTKPNRIIGNTLVGNYAGIAVGFGNFDQVADNIVLDSGYSISLNPVAVREVYLQNNLLTGLSYDPAKKLRTAN